MGTRKTRLEKHHEGSGASVSRGGVEEQNEKGVRQRKNHENDTEEKVNMRHRSGWRNEDLKEQRRRNPKWYWR